MRTRRAKVINALRLSVIAALLAVSLAALTPVPVAHAATITVDVDTTTDSNAAAYQQCTAAAGDCTLRGAISKANADTANDYVINLAGLTYPLSLTGVEDSNATGDLDITSNITINGAGAGTTIIDGGAQDRVFHVTGAFTVNISGVTVRNGNIAGHNGGGIWNHSGKLTITNCTFSRNSAGTAGGIWNDAGELTITNSTFSGNSAANGGAIHNWVNGELTITNSTFSGNSAIDAGGAIYNHSGAVTITNSTFSAIPSPTKASWTWVEPRECGPERSVA